MRVSTLLVVVPIVLIAGVIAVANRAPVFFSLDPFSADEPALAFSLPLFMLIFLTFLLGVLLGGLTVWIRRRSSHRSGEKRG